MPHDPSQNQQGEPAAAGGLSTQAGGSLIGARYRILDRLGAGAMADVYRARDETLDREVAVKVFRAGVEDGDTAGTARRELELQALARLSHPNLVMLFDGRVSDGDRPAFLALELVEGPTLAAALAGGALPEPQVRQIGAQIADALAYVHQRGMVHRDVKPANILLGRDGVSDPTGVRARLSDFGIVRLIDSTQVTAAELTLGTAYYLAPEQARSAAVGPAADLYSLGLVLVEALTGRRVFEGAMHEVLLARLTRDPDIPPDLPDPWPGLLRSMTAAQPELRPSAAAVASALRAVPEPGRFAITGGPAGLVRPPTIAGPRAVAPVGARPPAGVEPARGHLTGMLLAAATFLAIITGAGCWFYLHPSGHPLPPNQAQQGRQVQRGMRAAPPSGTVSARSGGPHRGSPRAGVVPVTNTEAVGPGGAGGHSSAAPPATSQPAASTSASSTSHPITSRPSNQPTPTASTSSSTTTATTSAQATSSAPPSSSTPPTSSAPPSSSTPPTSSAPPSSSSPSTSSAPPPSSSPAPGAASTPP